MLALEPLRSCKDEDEHQMGSFSMGEDDFTAGNLLDDIDFEDLFAGIDYGDVLPDLEIDPDMLAEFSLSGGEEYSSELNNGSVVSSETKPALLEETSNGCKIGDEYLGYNSGSGLSSSTSSGGGGGGGGGEEIVSKREDDESAGGVLVDNKAGVAKDSTNKEANKGRKSSSTTSNQSKGGSHGNNKRKVKVDWTPELHRRFVQAVEQLGMDKAVPSRILELMGIDCLTRHNIASHLQKYRSHQKHLLAREAEAASWSQRRQIYGGTGRSSSSKRDVVCNSTTASTTTPWIAPTMGFPPPPPPPPAPTPPPPTPHPSILHHHPLRPLHVWGHPTAAMDQTAASFPQHIWPKHLIHHSPSPPPRWATPPHHPPPPADSSFWHHHHQRVSANLVTAGTPCFTAHQRLATSSLQRISGVPHHHHPVPGVPPPLPPHHAMYKVDRGMGVVPAPNGPHSDSHPPFHLHPSKESIDAAIGDVLSKPWLPLPLGLKPPALDSVMVELHRQGVPEIPPTGTASTSTTTACA